MPVLSETPLQLPCTAGKPSFCLELELYLPSRDEHVYPLYLTPCYKITFHMWTLIGHQIRKLLMVQSLEEKSGQHQATSTWSGKYLHRR